MLAWYVLLPLALVVTASTYDFFAGPHTEIEIAKQRLVDQETTLELNELVKRIHGKIDVEQTETWRNIGSGFSQPSPELSSFLGLGNECYEDVPPHGVDWEREEAARRFAGSQAANLARLREFARKRPNVANFDSSIEKSFSEIRRGQTIAAAIDLAARVAIRDQDSDEVKESVLCLMRCRRMYLNDPAIVASLIRFNFSSRAIELLKIAIEQGSLAPEHLQQILVELKPHMEIDPGWRDSVTGERALHWCWMKGESDFGPTPNVAHGWRPFRVFQSSAPPGDLLFLLKFTGDLELAPTNNLAAFRDFLRSIPSMQQTYFIRCQAGAFPYDYTGLQQWQSVGSAFYLDAVRHRLACVATGIELFRQTNGRLPSHLIELNELGIDEIQLRNHTQLPFGFNPDATDAQLWIGDPLESYSTPTGPTEVIEGNESWSWRFQYN